MRNNWTIWLMLIALALALWGCGSPEPEEQSSAEKGPEPLPEFWKIGVIMPLSGNLAAYGQSVHEGIQLMADELNKNGGVLGRPVSLVLENNEGNTVKSAEAFRKLSGLNKVLAVVGPITSTQAMAISRDAQRKGVTLITPTGTNDAITQDGDYVFRACFNDSFQGIAVARFAYNDLGLRSALSFQDTASDYSVGLCAQFDKTFAELGGQVMPILSYKTQDTDFTPQIRKMRESGAQGIFIPGYPPELPLIINQIRNLGLEATLLGADGWDNEDTVQNAGANLEGTYFSAAFSAEVSTPGLKKFLELAQAAEIRNPGTFEALGYDSLGLVAEAIRQANPQDGNLENLRKSIKDHLGQVQNFQGATGSISMQPSGDPVKSLVMIQYVLKEGQVAKQFVKTVDP